MRTARCIDVSHRDGELYFTIKTGGGLIVEQLEAELAKNIKCCEIYVDNIQLTKSGLQITKLVNDTAKKLDELDKFMLKQRILKCKIFEFDIDANDCIHIVNYYDEPARKVVVIPSFVDYLDRSLFTGCSYVQKVNAKSNIHGGINYLFDGFRGTGLDLSEFDTSNISCMQCTFAGCEFHELRLNGKFNTSKVRSMSGMFSMVQAELLQFGESFNTRHVVDMQKMFDKCKIQVLDVGKHFNTSNVETMFSMFSKAHIRQFSLGNEFDTSKVQNMNVMFEWFMTDSKLVIDFNTTMLESTRRMFRLAQVKEIEFRPKFVMKKGIDSKLMLRGCQCRYIFSTKLDEYTRSFLIHEKQHECYA